MSLDFFYKATSDKSGNFIDIQSPFIVLYFYPKNHTPGCTKESQNFRDLYLEFAKLQAEIIGVSKDSIHSHEKFKQKHHIPYELISDDDGVICKLFKVDKPNNMLEKLAGIERSTFLIGPEKQIIKEWRKVKVSGHAQEVLSFLKSHKSQ